MERDLEGQKLAFEPGGGVAIITPLGFFLMVFGLVFAPVFFRYRRRKLDAALQEKAIAAGLQFIPELPAAPLPRRNDKRTGLLVAGLGAGVGVPLLLIGQPQVAAFSLTLVFLGAVYFLCGALLTEKADK